jgi:hypothetical protein
MTFVVYHPHESLMNQILKPYRNLQDACMKTTLDLNDALLARAKLLAARQRIRVTRLIEEGLDLRLRASAMLNPARTRAIPFYHGNGGLAAGVNPLSNKALLQAADGDAAR